MIPMQPDDLVRQSMPFSYLYINTASNDGNAHNVRLYSDITGGKTASCFFLAICSHLA